MAKGLSDTQKTILNIVADMPAGSIITDVYETVKIALYPELYVKREGNFAFWSTHKVIRYTGIDSEKKNVARATVSRSINRLMKRGCLITKQEQRENSYGYFVTKTVVYITDKCKQVLTVIDSTNVPPLTDKKIRCTEYEEVTINE